MTPIEMLIDRAAFRCTCCGENGCDCWEPWVDRCKARCVLHCKCRDCREGRREGLWRVNWAGIRHLYFKQDAVTLCKRKPPPPHPGSTDVPIKRVRGDECKTCLRAINALCAE